MWEHLGPFAGCKDRWRPVSMCNTISKFRQNTTCHLMISTKAEHAPIVTCSRVNMEVAGMSPLTSMSFSRVCAPPGRQCVILDDIARATIPRPRFTLHYSELNNRNSVSDVRAYPCPASATLAGQSQKYTGGSRDPPEHGLTILDILEPNVYATLEIKLVGREE